jgi:hypothetical protein
MPATPVLVPLEAPELVEAPEAAPLPFPEDAPEPNDDVPLEPPVSPTALAPVVDDPPALPVADDAPFVPEEPELALAASPDVPPAVEPELAPPAAPAPPAGAAADPLPQAAAQSARMACIPTKTRAFILVRGAKALVRSQFSAENVRHRPRDGEFVIVVAAPPTHDRMGPA